VLVYTELSKRETRRMQLLGIPTYVLTFVCSSSLGALWAVLFIFVALIPYSFFYSKAYGAVAATSPTPPGWRFYTCVVLVQLAFIAALVARLRA
jgi:hypothetical protein